MIRFRAPRAERDALRWFAKMQSGINTEETKDALNDWLRERPENAASYMKYQMAWNALDQLENDKELMVLLNETQTVHTAQPSRDVTNIDPSRRRWLLPISMAASFAIAAVGYLLWSTSYTNTYGTSVGEERSFSLPDGSQMTLNTGTTLTVSYSLRRRSISLNNGEALFRVAHNAWRPFSVSAADKAAVAVGTQFDVMRIGSTVTVSVLQGIVNVSATQESGPAVPFHTLVAGEAISFDSTADPNLLQADLQRIEAWQRHRIEFTDRPLREVIQELNRYSRVPLILGDPILLPLRVTGAIRVGNSEHMVLALGRVFNLHAVESDHSIILLPSTDPVH